MYVCSSDVVNPQGFAPRGVSRDDGWVCILSLCVVAREEFTVLAVSREISLHFSSRVREMLCKLQLPLD